jgi:hypothetical protein
MTANVALTDTFDQWRVKTNEVLIGTQADGMANIIKTTDTTNSTSNTTGSIITAGGVGIAKSAHIGGDLKVWGDVTTVGDTTISGNLTFGDASTDQVTFSADINSSMVPNANLTFNLGNTTQQWANAWVGHAGITQKTDSGKPALSVTSTDTNQIAVDIAASQIDADVLNITADAVTTAKVIDITADGLTTGPALYIDSDSSSTSTRSIATIIQNHASAVGSTGLTVQADAGRGVFIDTNLAAGGYALEIDAEITTTNTAKIAAISTSGTTLEVSSVGVLTGKVIDITADAATTGTGINMSMDGLTTGTALAIDSNSADTGIRNIASIIQNHASAVNATTLHVQNDSTGMGIDIRGGIGTGAAGAGKLRLSTAETTVVDGDVLGMVQFMAPLEAGGTDAVLVAACIQAEADDTFAADNNATELVFKTAASEAATEQMRLTSTGQLGINTAVPASLLHVDGTVQVGVDNTGYDVKFFGATSGDYMLWDEDQDQLVLSGTMKIKEQADADSDTAAFGQIWVNTATPNELYFTTDAGDDIQLTTGTRLAATPADGAQIFNESGADVDFRIESDDDVNMFFVDGSEDKIGIGTSTPASKLDVQGTVQVGVDNTGYDVKFFGATASAYMLWDEDVDDLILGGVAGLVVPDGQFTLGSTAVTATAAEINGHASTGKAIAMAIVFG